ncbi:LIP-domain-containing protein [Xylariaceae sp. FL0594]|nr:LIP-domain-containing protein [Xylariaceae sp. FL0594]
MRVWASIGIVVNLVHTTLSLAQMSTTQSLLSPLGFAEAGKAEPLPPSRDPWYSAPEGFETATSGTVLRLRIAPGNLTTEIVKNASAAYHILYRTTDSLHQPSWAVTTLFIPTTFHATPSGKKALISYQFAYNSADVDSSPSYGFYNALSQPVPSLNIPASTDLLTQLLSKGWIVNSPDYEGPRAAFGASIQSGHATLDAIRAVVNLTELTGLGPLSIAMWGYSGGSIATEAAAELQAEYAPSLSISGAVAGGLVDSLSGDFNLFNGTPLAGNLVAVVLGLVAQYPEALAYIRSRLKPETADEFLAARHMSTGAVTSFFSSKDIFSYFIGGGADLQAAPLQRVYRRECRLGHYGLPGMPLFLYKAIGDQYCPISSTDALAARFRDAGVELTFERNTVGGHVAEIGNAKPRVFEWLESIFGETYRTPAGGYSIRDVTVNITGLST